MCKIWLGKCETICKVSHTNIVFDERCARQSRESVQREKEGVLHQKHNCFNQQCICIYWKNKTISLSPFAWSVIINCIENEVRQSKIDRLRMNQTDNRGFAFSEEGGECLNRGSISGITCCQFLFPEFWLKETNLTSRREIRNLLSTSSGRSMTNRISSGNLV